VSQHAPCFQHDSYHSECSSCRDLNGVEQQEDWRVRLAKSASAGKGLTLSRAEVRALYKFVVESRGSE